MEPGDTRPGHSPSLSHATPSRQPKHSSALQTRTPQAGGLSGNAPGGVFQRQGPGNRTRQETSYPDGPGRACSPGPGTDRSLARMLRRSLSRSAQTEGEKRARPRNCNTCCMRRGGPEITSPRQPLHPHRYRSRPAPTSHRRSAPRCGRRGCESPPSSGTPSHVPCPEQCR